MPALEYSNQNSVTNQLLESKERTRQLEAELKRSKADAAQARARMQAFADTCRMQGLQTPHDGMLAFWEEAQALLQSAVEGQYGKSMSALRLSVGELRACRHKHEQIVANGEAY